jgi:hypothetical protein
MPTEPESRVTERSKIAIASILATVLLAFLGWAVQIGSALASSIGNLEQTVAVLTHKVERLPPPELLLRLEFLEEEQSHLRRELERQETMNDRVEEFVRSMHVEHRFPPARPYTNKD